MYSPTHPLSHPSTHPLKEQSTQKGKYHLLNLSNVTFYIKRDMTIPKSTQFEYVKAKDIDHGCAVSLLASLHRWYRPSGTWVPSPTFSLPPRSTWPSPKTPCGCRDKWWNNSWDQSCPPRVDERCQTDDLPWPCRVSRWWLGREKRKWSLNPTSYECPTCSDAFIGKKRLPAVFWPVLLKYNKRLASVKLTESEVEIC